MPFSWRQIDYLTNDNFKPFLYFWSEKDIVMAANIIRTLHEIFDGTESRKKALVIINGPHSYKTYKNEQTENYDNETYIKDQKITYQYIADCFPGRTANVMINWGKPLVDERFDVYLAQNEKWDAAFAANNNKSVGFDFEGSVFGNDNFDVNIGYIPTEDIKYIRCIPWVYILQAC